MRVYLADNRQAWDLQSDGSYAQRTPVREGDPGSHQALMRDPWGLDRSESRYVTQEFRTAALTPAPAPEPHQHSVALGNGRRRKSKRNGS
jgi:hypothetical protein